MEIEVSEQLALLCDIRLEAGPEGFAEAVDELSPAEITELFGEAVDALLVAQSKHEREMRRLADRLQR
jgi:RNase adaptor protein for sRNA GlmZ degradation